MDVFFNPTHQGMIPKWCDIIKYHMMSSCVLTICRLSSGSGVTSLCISWRHHVLWPSAGYDPEVVWRHHVFHDVIMCYGHLQVMIRKWRDSAAVMALVGSWVPAIHCTWNLKLTAAFRRTAFTPPTNLLPLVRRAHSSKSANLHHGARWSYCCFGVGWGTSCVFVGGCVGWRCVRVGWGGGDGGVLRGRGRVWVWEWGVGVGVCGEWGHSACAIQPKWLFDTTWLILKILGW